MKKITFSVTLADDPGPGADSGSGSDSDQPEEYYGMEQPPLIKQLKGILSEYPDDGQIIKVRKSRKLLII